MEDIVDIEKSVDKMIECEIKRFSLLMDIDEYVNRFLNELDTIAKLNGFEIIGYDDSFTDSDKDFSIIKNKNKEKVLVVSFINDDGDWVKVELPLKLFYSKNYVDLFKKDMYNGSNYVKKKLRLVK